MICLFTKVPFKERISLAVAKILTKQLTKLPQSLADFKVIKDTIKFESTVQNALKLLDKLKGKEGKIIAQNLRGRELFEKLKTLIGD